MKVLNDLLDYPLSDFQIEKLFQAIDKGRDGEIDYNEFLQSFTVVDTQEKSENLGHCETNAE